MKKNFLEEMKERWPKLDFSNSVYVNYYTKFDFVCPIHGTQTKLPKYVKKYGCGICSRKNTYKKMAESNILKKSQEDFLKECNEIHNNRYDYSLVEYKGSHTPITVICPIHGQFASLPHNHNRGIGCIKCRNDLLSEKYRSSTEEFIEKALKIHGDKYDYSLVEYENSHKKVTLICKKHGNVKTSPKSVLYGNACPKCSRAISKPHRKLLEAFPDIDWSINDRKTLKKNP